MRTRPDHSVLDLFFRSLADSRRRFVLSHLIDDSDGSATFDELADGVVEAETHSPSPDRESVEVTLDHNHLPTLAENGLIEYDRDRGVVTTTSRTEQIQPYLAVVENLEHSEATPQ